MKKPTKRADLPRRNSDNDKRRLDPAPDPQFINQLLSTVHYAGSSKHKRNPHLFDLKRFNGKRGDETLCDEHAGFSPEDMAGIPAIVQRGLKAGLIGDRVLWTIGDNGWIFEARLTNSETNEYHGYPVRPTEAIGEPVFRRYAEWASAHGAESDKQALQNCSAVYGFKL